MPGHISQVYAPERNEYERHGLERTTLVYIYIPALQRDVNEYSRESKVHSPCSRTRVSEQRATTVLP